MKHIYRGLIIALCLSLWFLLDVAAAEIEQSAREAPYREPFPFPCFLQHTDIYAWSLSAGEDCAELLVQNIGDSVIEKLEIVFHSYDKVFVFCCEEMQPGEKKRLREVTGLACNDPLRVICVSVTEHKHK